MRTFVCLALGLLTAARARAEGVAVVILADDPKREALAGQVRSAIAAELAKGREIERWRDLVGSQGASVRAEGALRQKTQQVLAAVRTNTPGQAPVKELQQAMKGAAATAATADEQAAQVALAALAWLGGDVPLAERGLKDAFAFQLTPKPVDVPEPAGWSEAWQRASFAVSDRARGTLTVRSEPAGARVMVDGVVTGTTPTQIRGVLQGPHLVQLDLFGYELRGQLVTLAGTQGEQLFKLEPAEHLDEHEFRQSVLAAVLSSDGEGLATTARPMGIELFLAGWLAKHGKATTLGLSAVRVRDGAIVASRQLPLENLEDSQVTKLAAQVSGPLLEGKSVTPTGKVDAESHAKPRDPLDKVDGTEDW